MARTNKQIDRLRKIAPAAGFDVDGLIGEIVDQVKAALPPQPSLQELEEKVSLAVEARVGAKLDEVLTALKDKPGVDPDAITKSVAEMLGPSIQQASEKVLQANIAGIVAEVNRQLDERLKTAQGNHQSSPLDGAGQQAGQSLMGLVAYLLDRSTDVGNLIKAFRPEVTPEVRIAEQVGLAFRLHTAIGKIASGQATENDIQSLIAPPKK